MIAGLDEDGMTPIAIIEIEQRHNLNYVTSKEVEGMLSQSITKEHYQKLVMEKVEVNSLTRA